MKHKKTLEKILIIEGYEPSVIKSRLALLKDLQKKGFEVHVISPYGEVTEKTLQKNKMFFHPVNNNRHSISIRNDFNYFLRLYKKIKEINPTICLTYTIKPGIYGIMAAACAKVNKRYAVITGLGYSFIATGIKANIIKKIASCLYSIALKMCSNVIFQNEDDRDYFCLLKLVKKEKTTIVHGSGIDLSYFTPQALPKNLCFSMISRFLPEKGIFEYIEACKRIKANYPEVRCFLVGYIDNTSCGITESMLKTWQNYGIEYLGRQEDVRASLSETSVYVLPSYREGTPRSVLEAMAMGRPIVATNAPGCRQTVEEGKNGFLVPIKNSEALYQAMLRFINNPLLIQSMGEASLTMAHEKFDVTKINKDMLAIMKLT